jgi:hypothetical protein
MRPVGNTSAPFQSGSKLVASSVQQFASSERTRSFWEPT